MKLKSFTIAELVVGMLLTSLVAGLAYHCFFLFQRQFMQLGERTSHNNEYLLLRKAMQADIIRADAIHDSSGNYLIMQPQNILYAFSNSAIVRTEGAVTDSFKIQVISFSVDKPRMATQIKLQLQNNSLFFTKMYSAEQLMNE